MIQIIDIQELGWKHSATMLDGGTKTFKRETSQGVFLLTTHIDNFMYKDSPFLYRIKIEKFNVEEFKKNRNIIFTELYIGIPKNKTDLKSIITKLNIDLKETRKEKLIQIQNL